MISKKDLKELDMCDMEDYFQYIVDSETNGQFEQVKLLISDMSNKQKAEFRNSLSYYGDETAHKKIFFE